MSCVPPAASPAKSNSCIIGSQSLRQKHPGPGRRHRAVGGSGSHRKAQCLADRLAECHRSGLQIPRTVWLLRRSLSTREPPRFTKGWKGRLVNLPAGDTEGVRGLCLDPHDLAIAKYVACREKDVIFTRARTGRSRIGRAGPPARFTRSNRGRHGNSRAYSRAHRRGFFRSAGLGTSLWLHCERARLAHAFHHGRQPQHRTCDGERQKRQVDEQMHDAGLKRVLGEVEQKHQSNVLDSDRTQDA